MSDGCVDCGARPRFHELGSCFRETFLVLAPGGAAAHVTLWLCLRCGRRFAERGQLRDYLRTRLPAHAAERVPAVALRAGGRGPARS